MLFCVFSFVTIVIFYDPFRELINLSFRSELYSHVILIPLVSGYFVYIRRKALFSEAHHSYKVGGAIAALAILFYGVGMGQRMILGRNDTLSLMIFSAVLFWIGGFIFFYGVKTFKIASFPLLFLVFMIPIPSRVVDVSISFLQFCSAEVAYGFFKLTGVSILREGFTFHLPGLSIEVAEQCSGIRSSIALFITSIIAGQLFLRRGWKKLILAISIFPITILKNGLRIVTLSLLGVYVDPGILSSELHKSGGIPFFVVALILLAPVLWVLRKSETEKEGARIKDKGERQEVRG
jgi:exosortase